ncbi:uncharacterized protein LOC128194321 isoform X2 [Vigna angularis]|uniref:uncharacterized protein LOC128194321 isoform X2 n=1 Tax=Phaseolus angularis TaxID=3914 RepID=UPI0022B3F717|nr:uncharacterized protein LOC128194321 isoform X2 [Vigna angularis]
MVMQNSITFVFRQRAERGRYRLEGLRFGTTLRFVPGRVSQGFLSGNRLDRIRSQPRLGVRPPRITLILVMWFWVLFHFTVFCWSEIVSFLFR